MRTPTSHPPPAQPAILAILERAFPFCPSCPFLLSVNLQTLTAQMSIQVYYVIIIIHQLQSHATPQIIVYNSYYPKSREISIRVRKSFKFDPTRLFLSSYAPPPKKKLHEEAKKTFFQNRIGNNNKLHRPKCHHSLIIHLFVSKI